MFKNKAEWSDRWACARAPQNQNARLLFIVAIGASEHQIDYTLSPMYTTNRPKILWLTKSIIRRAFGSRTCFSILLLKFSWLDFSLLHSPFFSLLSLSRPLSHTLFLYIILVAFCSIFISIRFWSPLLFNPSHPLALVHSNGLLVVWVSFLLLSSMCLVDWCWCCSATASAPAIDYSVISSNIH